MKHYLSDKDLPKLPGMYFADVSNSEVDNPMLAEYLTVRVKFDGKNFLDIYGKPYRHVKAWYDEEPMWEPLFITSEIPDYI